MNHMPACNMDQFDFGVPAFGTEGTAATAKITFGSTQPTSGNTITINDTKKSVVFEFGGTGSNTNVAIGTDAATTMATFRTAIISAKFTRLSCSVRDTTANAITLTFSSDEGVAAIGALGNSATVARSATATVTVATFAGGADPGTDNLLLKLRPTSGGKLDLHFEADTSDLTFTLSTSSDNSIWTNASAISALSVPAQQCRDASYAVRPVMDTYLRITGKGGGRGVVTVKHMPGMGLDILKW